MGNCALCESNVIMGGILQQVKKKCLFFFKGERVKLVT